MTKLHKKDRSKRDALDPEYIKKLNKDRLDKQRVVFEFNIPTITVVGQGNFDSTSLLRNLSLESYKGFLEYLVLIGKSGSYSPHTIPELLCNFRFLVKTHSCGFIDVNHVLAASQDRTRLEIWRLKQFLIGWYKSGLSGVTEAAVEALLRLPPRPGQRPAGSAVRSPDPDEGHYEDDDYYHLVDVYWAEYESGVVDLHRTVARLLTAQYARRPVQLAHLKIMDLIEHGQSKGVTGRRIEFPGAKTRGSNVFRDGAIEVHPLSNDLWDLCQILASKTKNAWAQVLKRKLTPKEEKLLPLFSDFNPVKFEDRYETALQHHWDSTMNVLGSEYLHLSGYELTKFCIRRPLAPIASLITGNDLREGSRRMRYSRIRQLVRSGVSRACIQYWASHQDRSTINLYFDEPAEQARLLNDAIAPLMAPLAQAFSGTLIWKETDATRGSDPSSRIELDGKSPVGSCGEYGYCSASVPIPCYRCSKFEPWVYGPHQEVLERLLERKSMEEGAFRKGSGRRILMPLNFDRDITAVSAVINACEAQKKIVEEN